MAILKEEHEQRLAQLEHMMEELRVQTKECIRLTTEARLSAQAAKEKSQRAGPGQRGDHVQPERRGGEIFAHELAHGYHRRARFANFRAAALAMKIALC